MAGSTKYALEDALKKLLLQKPIDKITINDLTEECGISRMTFYYHFKDREWDRSSRLFCKIVRLS